MTSKISSPASLATPLRAVAGADRPRAGGQRANLLPLWVQDLMRSARTRRSSGDLPLQVCETADFRLIRATIPAARELSPLAFKESVIAAYSAIAAEIQKSPMRHPVRFWNYIPGIHLPSGEGIDRYMIFNAGRFNACRQWLGKAGAADNSPPDNFERNLPTASGIGHDGADLMIDALSAASPGIAVENPRQIPSYRYAKRYGPRPPCFARATLLPATARQAARILVGGTASILGEDTAHENSLAAQVEETLHNLASLIGAASRIHAGETASVGKASTGPQELAALRLFDELRIYYPRESDLRAIQAATARAFAPTARIQWMKAELCRRELLVEIEGVARCASPGDHAV